MVTHAVYGSGSRSNTRVFYYRGILRKNEGVDACEQAKNYRAGEMEARVWESVSGILKDPEQLCADLERMIELEREGRRGGPELEAKGWVDKLSEVDRKRSGFQDMVAEGLITFDELRAKLAALDATRAMAERELDAIKVRRDYLESLERDKEVLLDTYASLTPEALESLSPEERQRLYKMLRLRAVVNLDGSIAVGGEFTDNLEVCTIEAPS
jgi:hypothetical protein